MPHDPRLVKHEDKIEQLRSTIPEWIKKLQRPKTPCVTPAFGPLEGIRAVGTGQLIAQPYIGTKLAEFGAEVITQESPSYPESLRQIHSPPIVLYVWGEIQPRDHHAIGVIGARRTTHYGTEAAKKLSYQLAYAGLTIISGLARGIDTAGLGHWQGQEPVVE